MLQGLFLSCPATPHPTLSPPTITVERASRRLHTKGVSQAPCSALCSLTPAMMSLSCPWAPGNCQISYLAAQAGSERVGTGTQTASGQAPARAAGVGGGKPCPAHMEEIGTHHRVYKLRTLAAPAATHLARGSPRLGESAAYVPSVWPLVVAPFTLLY